jgi:hypothetical protein
VESDGILIASIIPDPDQGGSRSESTFVSSEDIWIVYVRTCDIWMYAYGTGRCLVIDAPLYSRLTLHHQNVKSDEMLRSFAAWSYVLPKTRHAVY